MTFKQAKRLVLVQMKAQGIKVAYITNTEIERVAIEVMQQENAKLCPQG